MAPVTTTTTTTTNTSSYDSENEWGYNMTRPRGRVTSNSHVQWGDDHDYVPADENARTESEEESEPVRRGVNHSTPDFLLSAHPELDPDYDQEYVTMSGRRIPSRRERDARRKDGPARDYLERIHMHEPGFKGRLVVANA
ncbi:hypothetical protein NLG97_g6462 [Lecanicillium saksenae]|uniref:Uncharacterized protein n=1 Tax=Lecanicillium saksenae TaxID=468837 RepID=A0ACC1QPP3_9HYPO|nr:hypothetical protein NLG97_g6462 [Lecanicillium saksenae]